MGRCSRKVVFVVVILFFLVGKTKNTIKRRLGVWDVGQCDRKVAEGANVVLGVVLCCFLLLLVVVVLGCCCCWWWCFFFGNNTRNVV